MPPRVAQSQTALAAPTPDDALKNLLTLSQLLQLDALITDIAAVLSTHISNGFDTTFKADMEAPQILKEDNRNPNISVSEGHRGDASAVQTRRDIEAPELKALKVDAMEFFQLWRDGIESRIVDAASSKAGQDGDFEDETLGSFRGPLESDDENLGYNINASLSNTALFQLYPSIETPLSSLPKQKRIDLLSAVLLLLLSQGYSSHSRLLMLFLTSSLCLPFHVLANTETKLAHGLLEAAKALSAAEETKKRGESNQMSRRWKVGLAGVAGAALIGVTGGLAAPLVAAGIGTIMGGIGLGGTLAAGLLGVISGSGVVVGSLFGAYGFGMTSRMMDEYAKEVEDFGFIPLKGGPERVQGGGVQDVDPKDRRLRVTIGISGWLTQKRDVITPWRVLGQESEIFALRWEVESLLKMGKSLESVVSSAVWTVASTEIISRTVFASLMFALWPIGLLKISKIVDNPFTVAKNRADKAGLVLADAIINKAQGQRPVTLIGYSMGARVIYSCLMSLAERRAFGLVESAVLIGAPTPSDAMLWRALKSVVAGRLVNVYAEKDYILAFLYRTSSIQYGIAGLQEIRDVKGVENFDVTNFVNGHLRYQHLMGRILEKIGWEDINAEEVRKEELLIAMLDEEESKVKAEQMRAQPQQGDLISFGDEVDPAVRPSSQPVPPVSKASDDLLDMLMGHDGIASPTIETDRNSRSTSLDLGNQFYEVQRSGKEQHSSVRSPKGLLDVLQYREENGKVKSDINVNDNRPSQPFATAHRPRAALDRVNQNMQSPTQLDHDLLSTSGARDEELQNTSASSTSKKSAVVSREQECVGKEDEESGEESGGIVMQNNDDTNFSMLEPVAMEDAYDP